MSGYARLLASAIPLVGLPLSVAAWSASTVNTATVAAPLGTFEANTANNVATDANNVMAALIAANDSVSAVNGILGGSNVLNVFAGDTVNGLAAGTGTTTLALASGASLPAGLTFDPVTGNVSVTPGTAAGTYSFDYTLCETANPTNCKTATVSVAVAAAAISADDDTVGGVIGLPGAAGALDVIPGDLLNGAQAALADVTLTVTTPASSINGGPVPTLNTGTGLVDVPAGTPAGTYAISYQACEKLNPANCTTATATIVVVAAPLVASADAPVAVNSAIGATGIVNAFANDTLNGVAVDPASIIATVTSPAAPINGGSVPVLNPATGLVDVPAGTPAGTYTIGYQICEKLNPTNCAVSTVTIVVQPAVSNLSGTVYTDVNGDRRLDAGDTRQAGWIIELVLGGKVVATTTSDSRGNYSFTGLLSGPGYSVRFRNPENNVVYDEIKNLTLGANETIVDQNLPIDPSGVIYDSVTRNPLAGVTVSLVDASGNLLPSVCFLDASQRNQVTGASGFYRFDIIPGAAAQCPVGETVYRIVMTTPNGYSSPSTVLLPQAGALDPTGRANPYLVTTSPNPPTDNAAVYYLTFRLQSGDPNVINNHIPIDPFLTRSPLVVTKTSTRRSAGTGDLVPYEIVVRNAENVQRAGVDVIDILPPGMKYVLGSASVNGAQAEPADANSGRELVWRNQVIPANGSVRYNLTLVVGAGVASGEKINTGVAENGATGGEISNRGTAAVSIVPSSVFDCSELLGKVFEDTNRNGYQDEGEPGVPGARVATVNGQLVTTDEHGRYHIACAAVPDARIGSNFVLKLDTRSLPLGWEPTTDNPRSIRLTRGKFGELNFGVAPQAAKAPTTRQDKGE
jgi:uncharacterized repeat protein (TIGR01451 family)